MLFEKNSLRYFVHMPGCVFSRCRICNYSSLFIRIGPDAYQRDRFAFLGPFALSLCKGFLVYCCVDSAGETPVPLKPSLRGSRVTESTASRRQLGGEGEREGKAEG